MYSSRNIRLDARYSPEESSRFDRAIEIYNSSAYGSDTVHKGDRSSCVRLAVKEWTDRILSGSCPSLCDNGVRIDLDELRDNLRFIHNLELHDFTEMLALLDLIIDGPTTS